MNVRLSDLTAMAMIGDGVLGAVIPERHVSRWIMGSREHQPMRVFVDHPRLTRVLGAAEAAAGLWWATRLPGKP